MAEEKDLIARSGAGDMEAFEALVLRYETQIGAAAFRLCGSREEGEDLAQETFVKAWRSIAGYRGQASLRTWLMAILTNTWRDRLRKNQVSEVPLDAPIDNGEGILERQWQDDSPGPDALMENREVDEVLGKMIQALPPEYKEALVLRDIQGFSYEEAAVVAGCSLGTIKSRINRARSRLRTMILAHQEQNPGFFRLHQTGEDKKRAGEGKGGESA